jgi:uncharacterized protein (DUF433 family)
MNNKLVESLVEVVYSLEAKDYAIFQQQLALKSIQKTEGVCANQARIRNTRIPVWTIISFLHQGAEDKELLENYPMLTFFDLFAVKNYYSTHQEEIDSIIANYTQEDNLENKLIRVLKQNQPKSASQIFQIRQYEQS